MDGLVPFGSWPASLPGPTAECPPSIGRDFKSFPSDSVYCPPFTSFYGFSTTADSNKDSTKSTNTKEHLWRAMAWSSTAWPGPTSWESSPPLAQVIKRKFRLFPIFNTWFVRFQWPRKEWGITKKPGKAFTVDHCLCWPNYCKVCLCPWFPLWPAPSSSFGA